MSSLSSAISANSLANAKYRPAISGNWQCSAMAVNSAALARYSATVPMAQARPFWRRVQYRRLLVTWFGKLQILRFQALKGSCSSQFQIASPPTRDRLWPGRRLTGVGHLTLRWRCATRFVRIAPSETWRRWSARRVRLRSPRVPGSSARSRAIPIRSGFLKDRLFSHV
jgi:hypothetical protein